jgi:hypothetical protein
MFVTGGVDFGAMTSSNISNPVADNSSLLMSPTIAESTNIFTAAWAAITNVASYLSIIIQIIFLWCPTVFSGYLLWFWWIICFPIDVGIVFSIVTIVRGVHSA